MSGEVTWQGAGAQSFKEKDIQRQVDEAREAKARAMKTGRNPGTEEIGQEDGVTAPAISAPIRGEAGRFLPGQSGNPAGRPRKEQETAVLTALRERVTPDEVVTNIIALMNHPSSWRAWEAGIRLYLEYTVGKPVQRIIEDGDSLDVFLARLRSG